MSVNFPAIRPSSREYRPPAVPITETRSEAGTTFRRRRGSLAVDAGVSLRFDVRPEADWEAIEAAWLDSDCGMIDLNLPSEIWKPGNAPTLPGLRWRFIPDQPPEKSSDKEQRGKVNVTVELRAIA